MPWAIWALAVATLLAFWRTSLTIRVRLSFMWDSASSNCAVSSLPWVVRSTVRSPSATREAASAARRTGSVMERVMRQPKNTASNTLPAIAARTLARVVS